MLLKKKRMKSESLGSLIREESKQFLQLAIPLVSAQITQSLRHDCYNCNFHVRIIKISGMSML